MIYQKKYKDIFFAVGLWMAALLIAVHFYHIGLFSSLEIDLITYNPGCGMFFGDCKPDYNPKSIEHLTLRVADTFGTTRTLYPSSSKSALFQLISFNDSKIVVKLAHFVSPLIDRKIIDIPKNSHFTFHNQACFTLNNAADEIPTYCLARSSDNINYDFNIISNLAP